MNTTHTLRRFPFSRYNFTYLMLEITHRRRFTVVFDRQRRRKWALRQKELGTIINCDSVIRRLTRYYSISSTVILYSIIYVPPPPPPPTSLYFIHSDFILDIFSRLLRFGCVYVCGCSVESICLIHSSAAVPSLCLYSYKLISCFIYEALSSSLFSMCLLFYFFFPTSSIFICKWRWHWHTE